MMMPIYTNLQDWAASLVIDFPVDNIPILINDDWKSWGNTLAQEGSFAANGVPGTGSYDDWKKYAEAVYSAMG